MKDLNLVSVDIGAGSGRVVEASYNGSTIKSNEIFRFDNTSLYLGDILYWDFINIMHGLTSGLRRASERSGGNIASIGIDTWGVDFGLLDTYGNLLSDPVSYRDKRTDRAGNDVYKTISHDRLNQLNSSLTYPFCTLFQLYHVFKYQGELARLVDLYLPMPCLINYFLTGEKVAENSILSGTQIFDVKSRKYRKDVLKLLGIDDRILPEIGDAGQTIGSLVSKYQEYTDLPSSTKVSLVCCQDSPSAAIGIPFKKLESDCCFINSGTWSVVGIESIGPVAGNDAFMQNFTNWCTYKEKNMFVKIFNGFYFVQECKKVWDSKDGIKVSYEDFYKDISLASTSRSLVDLESTFLFEQENEWPDIMMDYFKKTGQHAGLSRKDLTVSLMQSMVAEYAVVMAGLENLIDKKFKTVYMVGGGSLNRVFCQWLADCLGKEIYTGYPESTINGNIIIQLIALGEIGTLEQGREIIRNSYEEVIYRPESSPETDWGMLLEKYIKLKTNK